MGVPFRIVSGHERVCGYRSSDAITVVNTVERVVNRSVTGSMDGCMPCSMPWTMAWMDDEFWNWYRPKLKKNFVAGLQQVVVDPGISRPIHIPTTAVT